MKIYRAGKEDDTETIKINVEIPFFKQMPEVPPVSCILPSHILQVSVHHLLHWCGFY
jgi:hypothetical protein